MKQSLQARQSCSIVRVRHVLVNTCLTHGHLLRNLPTPFVHSVLASPRTCNMKQNIANTIFNIRCAPSLQTIIVACLKLWHLRVQVFSKRFAWQNSATPLHRFGCFRTSVRRPYTNWRRRSFSTDPSLLLPYASHCRLRCMAWRKKWKQRLLRRGLTKTRVSKEWRTVCRLGYI